MQDLGDMTKMAVMEVIIDLKVHFLMLHAKFQNHRHSGSGEQGFIQVFAINSHELFLLNTCI